MFLQLDTAADLVTEFGLIGTLVIVVTFVIIITIVLMRALFTSKLDERDVITQFAISSIKMREDLTDALKQIQKLQERVNHLEQSNRAMITRLNKKDALLSASERLIVMSAKIILQLEKEVNESRKARGVKPIRIPVKYKQSIQVLRRSIREDIAA